MKVAKFFAVLFASAGVLLMLAGCVICFASLHAPVKVLEYPEEVKICFERLDKAVAEGNFADLGQMIYGQPDLGADIPAEDPYTSMVWDAFRESMELSYTGKPYLTDSDFVQDATVTVLDIPALTEKLGSDVQSILRKQIAEAEDPTLLQDDKGNYRSDVVEKAMQQALEELLSQDAPRLTQAVTIKLIRRDDRWWVVPDQAFLKTVSGLAA